MRYTGLVFFALTHFIYFGPVAKADCVFLDFNNSIEEIDAARIACEQKGEKIWVIPPVRNRADRVEFRKTQDAYLAAWDHENTICGSDPGGTACTEAKTQTETINAVRFEEDKRFKLIDKDYLKEYLDFFNKKHFQISSFIISGHHTGEKFSGRFGEVTRKDIAGAIAESPPAGESVRVLYGWGCYTETEMNCVAKNGSYFRRVLPNLSYAVGFKGSAPASRNAASAKVLQALIGKESELVGAQDNAVFDSIFQKIPAIGATTANVCVKNQDVCRVITPKGGKTCDEVKKECDSIDKSDEAKESLATFKHYWNADPGYEQVPPDTQNGELRKVYEFAQKSFTCTSFTAAQTGELRELNPERVRRVLFDVNIRLNLDRYAAGEFKAFNALLDRLKFPASARLNGIRHMSRFDYLTTWGEIQDEVKARAGQNLDPSGRPRKASLAAVSDFLEQLNRVEQGHSCVPATWLENYSVLREQEDTCQIRSKMRSALNQ